MKPVISFEVLSQPIVPGVPNIPYVQQGFFIQVYSTSDSTFLNLSFFATPFFVASQGGASLFVNMIDPEGNVTDLTQQFLNDFADINVTIGRGAYLFGVQYIKDPTNSEKMLGTTPQDGFGTRGVVYVNSQATFDLLPTVRQVFYNYNSDGTVMNVSESAYAVPVSTSQTTELPFDKKAG